ncbi:MAG: single-stranded DNA-binding protein [Firmicutes bacterium]|nr:single-stranded DNA-binding protein [Bacillota bacterium]
MNSVVLIGRLTRDPEVRYTSGSQMAVCTFTIAIDRVTRQGEEKKTDFPRITVFGKQAENCERFLKKGRLVGVQGRLQTGSYTNKDGATAYTTDVVADRVEFLEWGDRQSQNDGFGAQQSYSAPSYQSAPAQPSYQSMPNEQPSFEPARSGEDYTPDGFTSLEEDIPF